MNLFTTLACVPCKGSVVGCGELCRATAAKRAVAWEVLLIASTATTPSDWLAEFPPPRSLPLDQEALRIYERAYYIGLTTESEADPPITFSTVALALLTGEDETSRWFAREAAHNGPFADRVAAGKTIPLDKLPSSERQTGRPSSLRLSSDKQLLTVSARAVLETAEEWVHRVSGSDIGVRHILASYVINPPAAHRKQMQDWGFQELRWRQSFFDWIGLHYTAEAWNDASQRAVPTKPVAAFERTLVKGEALAFPGDEQTMQVLQRAAKYHVERSDNWLRLQTLVFALIEQARCDPTVRSVLAPIWKAVEPIEEHYQAALHSYLDSRTSVDGEASFDALNISPRVLNGLEAARELAVMTSRDVTHVGVLQLAGALISRRVDNDEDLGRIGLDAQALRRALVDHAAARGQNADVWREALGEEEAAATGRPVDLNSDEPEAVVRMDADWKTDPLGIRPDVHSFAALLASRSLEPPLSIGLFGPWGSGKTTFLKRLRLVVDQRCADAKTALAAGMQSPWVRNVVHVEFNAWHFAEDALVSSLIDTIVREVRAFIKDDRPAIGMALLEMRAKTAESARRAVDDAKRRREEAREEVDVKAKELANHEAEARQSMVSLQNAMQTVWKATIETAMASQIVRESGLIDRIGGTVQSAEELQKRIDGIRARSAPMLAGLGWYRSVLFAGLVLGLPLVVAWLVQRLLNLDGFAQVLAWASTTLSAGALWLRAASGVAAKLDRAVGKISREVRRAAPEQQGLAGGQTGTRSRRRKKGAGRRGIGSRRALAAGCGGSRVDGVVTVANVDASLGSPGRRHVCQGSHHHLDGTRRSAGAEPYPTRPSAWRGVRPNVRRVGHIRTTTHRTCDPLCRRPGSLPSGTGGSRSAAGAHVAGVRALRRCGRCRCAMGRGVAQEELPMVGRG